jgi:hypothetical protein
VRVTRAEVVPLIRFSNKTGKWTFQSHIAATKAARWSVIIAAAARERVLTPDPRTQLTVDYLEDKPRPMDLSRQPLRPPASPHRRVALR